MKARLAAAAGAAALLIGCATQGAEPAASAQPKAENRTAAASDDPYPSTYRAYPGVVTAITGATIFDGEGGRIDNGTIVLADGRIQAVGGADTPVPEGATRIDGAGRWVTPGVTKRPAASIRVAPSGTAVSGPPIATIRPSARTTVPFSIRPPSPSKMVAPVIAVTTPG